MQHSRVDYDWKSYPLTTATGYEIIMFRITPKVEVLPSRGPLLMTHGMFSEASDFFTRTDDTALAWPIQLAEMGFDVWIGCTRGRSLTEGHATLNKAIPAEM